VLAQIADNLQRNYFACGNLSLLILHFRLFQWRLSTPYRLAPRAAARLVSPLVQPWLLCEHELVWPNIIMICEPSYTSCNSRWSVNCIQCAHSLPHILCGSERTELCFHVGVVTLATAMQVAATVAAHGNSVSVGMCQGYSAVLLPQLQQDGSQLMVTDDEASWIGKDLLTK